MIKITSELSHHSGWKSSISVLQINSYILTHTVQLISGSTMPMATSGKNVNILYQVWKSEIDKNNGAASYQPVSLPFNFYSAVDEDDEVNESYVYNLVKAKLNDLGLDNEWI